MQTPWLFCDSEGMIPTDNMLIYPEVESALRGRVTYGIYPDEAGTNRVIHRGPILEDDQVYSIVRMSAPAAVPRDRLMQRGWRWHWEPRFWACWR